MDLAWLGRRERHKQKEPFVNADFLFATLFDESQSHLSRAKAVGKTDSRAERSAHPRRLGGHLQVIRVTSRSPEQVRLSLSLSPTFLPL